MSGALDGIFIIALVALRRSETLRDGTNNAGSSSHIRIFLFEKLRIGFLNVGSGKFVGLERRGKIDNALIPAGDAVIDGPIRFLRRRWAGWGLLRDTKENCGNEANDN